MQPRSDTTVEQLMATAVLTLRESQTLADARLSMEAAGVRHLPIVDDQQHVVGMLSDRDITRILASGRAENTALGGSMTRAMRFVRPDTPAHEAIRLIVDFHIGALPVLDGDDRIVGLVTRRDFLPIAKSALREAAVQEKAAVVVDVW